MNEEEAKKYFAALGAVVPNRQPPVASLVASGKALGRRRTRGVLAAVAASVALVLGGGAVAGSVIGPDATDQGVPSVLSEPPSGMRYVGKGSVVMTVPAEWPVVEPRACEPVTNAAYFADAPSPLDCRVNERGTSSLRLSNLDSPFGREAQELATEQTVVNGLQVMRSSGLCGLSPGSCAVTFTVPSEGLAGRLLMANSSEQPYPDWRQWLDSLQVLPAGLTTVPHVPAGTMRSGAEALVEQHGLVAATVEPDFDAPVVATTPEAGTVVEVGATVGLVLGQPTLGLLTIRNEFGAPIWINDANGRDHIEPGKKVAYVTRRACEQGTRTATTLDGATISTYEAKCAGETWTVRPNGQDVIVPPGDSVPAARQGDAAIWNVSRGAPVNGSATSVPVAVQRLACNSGVTGEVLEPTIDYRTNEVVVTIDVKPNGDGLHECQGNNRVPYEVVLTEPLGDRTLVDGQCVPGGEATTTSHCAGGGVRWAP